MIGGPILSVYPGLDQDMLPLALVVVILGGTGSLLGSLVGSFVVGFLYNFGQAMFPELAYVDPVPADADRAGAAAAGPVRPGHAVKRLATRHRTSSAAGDAAVLDRQQLLHQRRQRRC